MRRNPTAGNLYLIGFSGAGKSSVGQLLADRLGWAFFDTDREIARSAKKPIVQIFADEGEVAFRAQERAILLRLGSGRHQVISLGGGTVVSEENRSFVLSTGLVVQLDARPETIVQRLRNDQTEVRPLLQAADPLARVQSLKASRAAVYSVADYYLPTDDLTPEEAAEHLLAWLGQNTDGNATDE